METTMDERFTGIVDDYLDGEDTLPSYTETARPRPGKYYLIFGPVETKDVPERRAPKKDRDTGLPVLRADGTPDEWVFQRHVEVTAPLTVASDAEFDLTYAGAALNKYYRLTNEPVRFKGEVKNFSTLSAALAVCNLEMPRRKDYGSDDEYIQAVQLAASALSGQQTQKPVTITVTGQYKYKPFVQLGESRLYLNEKAFRTLIGYEDDPLAAYLTELAQSGQMNGWATRGWVIDPGTPDAQWTLERPGENVLADVVYANLEPTPFGWKAR